MRKFLLLAGCSALTAALAGCEGAEGPEGKAGAAGVSCTVKANTDGTSTITCGDVVATVKDGAAGKGCSVADDGKGTKTITCGDGTTVSVKDGTAGAAGKDGASGTNGTNGKDGGSCTVKDNGDGSKTVSCPDGATATVADGKNGTNGKSCSVKDNGDGTKTISCEDGTTAIVADGKSGANGKSCSVKDNGNGTKTLSCDDGTSVTINDGKTGLNAAQVFNINVEMPAALTTTVVPVSMSGKATVKIVVKDLFGRGLTGLKGGTSGNVRVGLAKLVPPAANSGNPEMWKSYVNRVATYTPAGGTAVKATQATSDRIGVLVDNGDGSYNYTFSFDLGAVVDPVTAAPIPYEPTLTHRLSVQVSGTFGGVAMPFQNALYDWVPAGGAPKQKDVNATASCNECHDKLVAHGSRYEIKYCVTCHNAESMDAVTGTSLDMQQMIHGIHSAAFRLSKGAPEYQLLNVKFGEVTYPQGLNNCRKCHSSGDPSTPQGDYWQKFPTREACGACHANVDWTKHQGGQATNKACALCHTPEAIDEHHISENATPNNPLTPKGAYNFKYEIKAVTSTAGTAGATLPVITFRILKDAKPMNILAPQADLSGGPSFLLPYAVPQGGLTNPADWNNVGRAAAQPNSISLASMVTTTAPTAEVTGPDAEGFYTAKVTNALYAWPAGSTMRGVALQGYWTQLNLNGASGVSLARHTVAASKNVTGDPARREIVDSAKCGNCHEWFEGHGGNRVYDTLTCVMCHNPNLSTSGRGANVANLKQVEKDKMIAAGLDPANPLSWPEASNNFKDMIHAIHGSAARSNAYEFVRDRGTSGVFFYDFSEVTFPSEASNCLSCHKTGTYTTNMNPAVLPSTQRTTTGNDASTTAVVNVRKTVPNASDLITSPITATCNSCHDTPVAAAHMKQNGGYVNLQRDQVNMTYYETCNLCHGPGKTLDVKVMHNVP
jgi:OmcA/MtrC family decaheme c-type cytochrome